MKIKSDVLCPAFGCDVTSSQGRLFYRDHLGKIRSFCSKHGEELNELRRHTVSLLVQIEGLHRVVALCYHDSPPNCSSACLRCALQTTAREQGALLVQLIKRERELTGAVGAKG